MSKMDYFIKEGAVRAHLRNLVFLSTFLATAICPGLFPALPYPTADSLAAEVQAAAPEPVRIRWISHWKDEEARDAWLKAAKKDFEFLHPGVELEVTYNVDLPGNEKNYKVRAARTIVSMIETGRIDYDIVFFDLAVYEHVSELLGNPYWTRDHLVDFSGVPGFARSQKPFITKDPRYRDRLGGILPGPFIEGFIHNPWFNSSLAEKVGIRVKEREMNFEDLLGYAKALHLYNKANNSNIPFLKMCSWNRLELLFESFFKSLFDDYDSAVSEEFNERKKEAFLRTLLAFEELAQYGPVLNSGWENLSFSNYIKEFLLEDDGLFITGGTYMYGHFFSLDPERSLKLKPVETPVIGRENGLIGDYTPTFAVMKNSLNRQTAVDFLLFLSTPESAESWVIATRSPTGIWGNLAEFSMDSGDIYQKFAMDMQQKYSTCPMASLRVPTYVFGRNNPVSIGELRASLAHILEGKLTARQYFDDVMSRLGD
jgi:ABC-type glycerol-3-phosphate transport system substrate-binding protein